MKKILLSITILTSFSIFPSSWLSNWWQNSAITGKTDEQLEQERKKKLEEKKRKYELEYAQDPTRINGVSVNQAADEAIEAEKDSNFNPGITRYYKLRDIRLMDIESMRKNLKTLTPEKIAKLDRDTIMVGKRHHERSLQKLVDNQKTSSPILEKSYIFAEFEKQYHNEMLNRYKRALNEYRQNIDTEEKEAHTSHDLNDKEEYVNISSDTE